jgi:osmotically-inducible protein OsmY
MKTKITTLYLAVCLTAPMAAVVLSGCAGDKYNRSTGEYIDDKGISMRVKSALNDNSEYKCDDVNVTTFRGTVQLSGFVNNSAQKSKAAQIAKTVQGVREVDNNISVKEVSQN